ncbi:hypothetical protein AA0120_g12654 [Alternaria tenuissima]|nr:hypothetical protein AA0120_g12654 [Alternaria tenuissima]
MLSREREASEETQSTRPLIAVAELKDVEVTLGPPVSGSPKAVPEVNESPTTTTTTKTTQVNELRTTASRTIVLQTNEAHTIESRTTETQANELESREMESWLTFQQAAEPQATKVTEATKEDRWYDFESHYGLSRNSIRDALQEVLDDMATHKSIHNWDRKLHITPLKHLCSSRKGRRLLSEIDKSVSTQDAGKTERSGSAKVMQGRIVLVKEHIHPLERAVLLILFSLYIRLQNEDYGYIYAFIERHLSLRNVLKSPHRWQLMSSPHINSSVQRYYKRVTLSCHIIYLTLNHGYISNPDAAIVDRTLLFPLHKQADGKTPKYVFKASTSVLLTIAIPEESASRQEETDLLKSPKGLWTVMVVNHALRLTLDQDQEPVENLTPITQYLRGISLSVNTQTMSAEAIYDHLKEQLAESENDSLFDDEQFSKSELYHWTIKTCDELRESITSSQRFLTQAFNKQISQLCLESNDSEKIGVDFWKMQLDEEMYALEELRSQIVALNAQVQESRSAVCVLHGSL